MDNEMSPNTIDTAGDNAPVDAQFFSVSLSKLRNLYLLTFGFYSVYWFYKHWKLQQPSMEKEIMPIARAIFSIFFTHSLARRIKQAMQSRQMPESRNLLFLATVFVALVIVANIIGRFAGNENAPLYLSYIWIVLFYVSAIPLVEMQDKVNRLKNDPLGKINSEYSWHNILFMAMGGFLWFMMLLGILIITLNT